MEGTNKMVDTKKIIKIGVVALVIITIAILLQPSLEISTGVDDKGIKLKVYGWRDGVKVGELAVVKAGQLFSTVEFGPPIGTPFYQLDAISIGHDINEPGGETGQVEVTDLVGTFTTDNNGGSLPVSGDARYETALALNNQNFILSPGGALSEESGQISVTDLEDDCNDDPYCTFKLTTPSEVINVDPVTGTRIDQAITPTPFGTAIIQVIDDACDDGTPWDQCSIVNPGGKFCKSGTPAAGGLPGTPGTLINCASPTGCTENPTGCACSSGYYETDGDKICTSPVCDSGTVAAGDCTGLDAVICNPSCTAESCNSYVNCERCGQLGQGAGTPLGWTSTTANAAECAKDYYVNLATSCTQISGLCGYRSYTGSITVNLQQG